MIYNLGIKKMQVIYGNIKNQRKNEKLGNRTRQIIVEELQQWVMYLGSNPQDTTYLQDLMKNKDT
jgi:hypothetical protein